MEQGGWVDFFFVCTFIRHIYYFFTDIKVNMTDQSSQAGVVSRTSFKGQSAKVFLIHLSALCSFSGLSEHATIKKQTNKAALFKEQ